MKKIISITLAVLMLCTLSIPAFAAPANVDAYYTPKITKSGEYTNIYITGTSSSAWSNMTIENNATVTVKSAELFFGALTVKSGSTLRIKENLKMVSGTSRLTIEEGAKVEILSDSKAKLEINGDLIIAGEFIGEFYNYTGPGNDEPNNIEIQGNGLIDLRHPYNDYSYHMEALVENLKKDLVVTQIDDRVIAEKTTNLARMNVAYTAVL